MRPLGFQLYSARENADWSATFATLAELGYRHVEGYGALYAEVPALADLLAGHDLSMPTGHVALDALEQAPAAVLDTARSLGCSTLFAPFIAPDQRPEDLAGWRAFGRRLSGIGQRVRADGFAFGWHNHDFEFQPLADGTLPIEVLFGEDDELEWEADLAWVVRAGADPLQWVDTLGERIAAVHVKDIAPEGENVDEQGWADPGEGTMAWPDLVAAVLASGRGGDAIHWIAEHDRPSDIARFARNARAAFLDWQRAAAGHPGA